jgi:proteasome assembly chaperone (PAC2) family protein
VDEEIRIDEKVKLHDAVMIIGLDGWGNGGKVSTFTVKYLADKLGAKELGEIMSERFQNYLIHRPLVSIKEGIVESYVPPRNELFYWKGKDGGRDLVLLLGFEPHHEWPRYTKAILTVAEEMDVRRIYTIGGYLADVSHEKETPISSSTNNGKIISELEKAGLELTNYRGPTSVYSEILWRSKEQGLDVVSLWGAVPMYVTGIYPKATYYMLKKITQLIGMDLNLGDLKKRAEDFKAQFERDAMSQSQMRSLIVDIRRNQEKEPTYIL